MRRAQFGRLGLYLESGLLDHRNGHPLSVVLKAYLDGSFGFDFPRSGHMTLAGFIGSDEAWKAFNELWISVMSRWLPMPPGHRSKCGNLHMWKAWQRADEFEGWERQKVNTMLADLFNNCFTPMSRGDLGTFRAAVATIDLDDYYSAAKEWKDLSTVKPAAALCLDFVLHVALATLQWAPLLPSGRRGELELFFDQGEPFRRHIQPVIERGIGVAPLISSVATTCSAESFEIQAADLLAWSMNRGYSKDDAFFGMVPALASGAYQRLFSYEQIVSAYQRALALRHDGPTASFWPWPSARVG